MTIPLQFASFYDRQEISNHSTFSLFKGLPPTTVPELALVVKTEAYVSTGVAFASALPTKATTAHRTCVSTVSTLTDATVVASVGRLQAVLVST